MERLESSQLPEEHRAFNDRTMYLNTLRTLRFSNSMHRSLSLSISFLLLLSLIVLTVPASAAPLTVDPTGQYKTITDAVNAAQPGDTIAVSPGTYTENVVVTKSVTITAQRADSPQR